MSESHSSGRGKVILLGEHAVVYGVPALVVGLDRGATARTRASPEDEITLLGASLAREHELYDALSAARRVLAQAPVHLDLELDIPAGAGLGASAALGVASARALLGGNQHADESSVAAAADAWEQVLHGNPSGVDRSAAQLGGVLSFTKHRTPEPVPLRRTLHLAVAIAGPPASTKDMVQMVANLRASNPAQFEKNLEAIRSLVDNATLCLRSGDLVSLGKLMDLCQMVLAGWMLSSEAIEVACKTARSAGALGAKLTGSGGGGAIVALAQDPAIAERVQAAFAAQNLPSFVCQIEAEPDRNDHHGGHAHG